MSSPASSLPLLISETIQTASLNRAPSPTHDLNPSTAASAKEPVTITEASSSAPRPKDALSTHHRFHSPPSPSRHDSSSARIRSPTARTHPPTPGHASPPFSPEPPYLRPTPRHRALPPLPDLRFEQSYLASLQGAEGWRGVGYVTVRDQVLLPLLQGTLWTLLLVGWRHWNRSASYAGRGVGARVRRWWWGVNNWAIPGEGGLGCVDAKGVGAEGGTAVGMENEKLAGEVAE
ncbi:hypothetical protein MMC34_001501, partial [Xylographa carneopallida]|nr:hypothetical protein [Xylographa carneopallida]